MRTRPLLPFAFLLTLGIIFGLLQTVRADGTVIREMRIDPGTTGIPLGKARLSVELYN